MTTEYDPVKVFRENYITSGEIARDMGVSRVTVMHHRKAGHLPGEIEMNNGQVFIWERRLIQPYIDAWKRVRENRAFMSKDSA